MANERGGPDNITVIAARFDGDDLPETGGDEPGYHELITTDERPALQPTAAFPAAKPAAVRAPPTRRSPTGLVLGLLTVAMAIVATLLLLTR